LNLIEHWGKREHEQKEVGFGPFIMMTSV
jgi:hypothetical protein